MDLGRYTVLAIVFGQKDIVDVRRRSNGVRTVRMSP
jgi:hypothetical protein